MPELNRKCYLQLADVARRHKSLLLDLPEHQRVSGELQRSWQFCAELMGEAGSTPFTRDQKAEAHTQVTIAIVFLLLVTARTTRSSFARTNLSEQLSRVLATLPPIGSRLDSFLLAPETKGPIETYLEHLVEALAELPFDDNEDPLAATAYFGEHFLAAYAGEVRRSHGVYYTPASLISYVLRSVEFLVQSIDGPSEGRGGRDGGDLKPRIVAVDPACGHGAFLDQLLQKRLSHHHSGLPVERVVGYELLPGSCAVANLLLRLRLATLGPRTSNENVVSCINPLAGVVAPPDTIPGSTFVAIGNPPYANFGRRNREPWIMKLLEDYKVGVDEKKLNLTDDFIKFIRWAQFGVEQAGAGIVAFVTNNTFLAGLTHRGMRQSLLHTFDDIYILDLHGSVTKQLTSPGGQPDENVFGIRQGVAISLMIKRRAGNDQQADQQAGNVHHVEMWGSRESKLARLEEKDVSSLRWNRLRPRTPFFFFKNESRKKSDAPQTPEWSLDNVFREYTSGVQSKNDKLFVDHDREQLAARMREWINQQKTQVTFNESRIRRYMVAPFDYRWIYYDPALLGRARFKTMQHMHGDNFGLVFMRQSTNSGSYDHFLATRHLVSDRAFYSAHGAPFLAPFSLILDDRKEDNLRPEFREFAAKRLGRTTRDASPSASELVAYMYSLFHCDAYRHRFADQLRIGFPPVPLTKSEFSFRKLALLGRQLLEIHLAAPTDSVVTDGVEVTHSIAKGFPRSIPLTGKRADKGNDQVKVLIDEQDQLVVLPAEVWSMRIGGYEVLPRWLKQRRGRPLRPSELVYFHELVAVLRRTRQLISKVNAESGHLEFLT